MSAVTSIYREVVSGSNGLPGTTIFYQAVWSQNPTATSLFTLVGGQPFQIQADAPVSSTAASFSSGLDNFTKAAQTLTNPTLAQPSNGVGNGGAGGQSSTATRTPTTVPTTGPLWPSTPTDSSTPPGGTSTSTPPPTPPGASSNAGAIAGAAVGCLIAGLLIGFAVAFLLYRRRKQQGLRYETAGAEPKYAAASPLSSVGPPPPLDQLQLSQFLLDTVPDKDISGELGALNQLIQNHVENHYHLQPAQANPAALAQALANLGLDDQSSSAGVDTLVALALDPRTRLAAIRHVVSFVVFSSVDFGARSRLSMLPPPVAAFLQSVPPAEHQRGNVEAASIALSRWRTLSAFLLHPQRAERTPLVPSEHAVLPQAAGLVNALASFLQPFVAPGAAQGQAEHLRDVVVETTKLGYVLLSQPADWRFTHSAPVQPGLRYLVVCAGLLKVGNKDGQPYDAPRQVAAPLLVQV